MLSVGVSDRVLLSVLWYLRESPGGEDAMETGLRLFDLFGLGDQRFSVPENGKIDIATFSDEPRPYPMSDQDLTALRIVLSRPGQQHAMWLCSARALRCIRDGLRNDLPKELAVTAP